MVMLILYGPILRDEAKARVAECWSIFELALSIKRPNRTQLELLLPCSDLASDSIPVTVGHG